MKRKYKKIYIYIKKIEYKSRENREENIKEKQKEV